MNLGFNLLANDVGNSGVQVLFNLMLEDLLKCLLKLVDTIFVFPVLCLKMATKLA